MVGALAFGLLTLRFGGDALAVVIFGAWFATLVVGLATDLDQRLLPDVLTLPVIPVALVYALSGRNPLVGDEVVIAIVAALVIPAVLYLPSIPFGAGAFGMGDVKLLIGVGLMAGGSRALASVIFALRPGRDRHRRAARDAADRPPVVHPVRPVLHPRRAVGRAHPGMTVAIATGPRRDYRVRRHAAARRLDFARIMPPSRCRPEYVSLRTATHRRAIPCRPRGRGEHGVTLAR